MITMHITNEEAQLIHRILLTECIEGLLWIKQSSSGPSRDSMQSYVDRLQSAILHITKAITLDKGTDHGNSQPNNC